jgi:UDP-N-acetylmuramoyl-L-alanyl-D-glutamate--2,6-diaminopimelate ligase
MKILNNILNRVPLTRIIGRTDCEITELCLDSRYVKPGFLFAAIKGSQTDGHHFIESAIENGASAILCETLPIAVHPLVTYIVSSNAAASLGEIAANFYDRPTEQLKLIGITGTNGKTTVSTILYELLERMGYPCGLISTVVNKIHEEEVPSTHTTPDVVTLNALLARMVEKGCGYAFMEVSSHALEQGRVAGVSFSGAVFTNLTHDHLDYHKTFDQYRDAKKKLFDHLSIDAFALTNKDDKNGMVMLQNSRCARYAYSLKAPSDFKGKLIEQDFEGMELEINGESAWYRLVGTFNAYNLMAAYATAFLLEFAPMDIIRFLTMIPNVAGRFDTLRSKNRITGIVDYAHTPDALKNVLQTINDIRSRNEQLITIVGCGGNRDAEKRPIMGGIAGEMSDRVVLTSDNPRNEDAEEILKEMMAGVAPQNFKKVLKISDREEAIKTALSLAKGGDIILLAGKGHEKYQEIKGTKHPFDDRAKLAYYMEMLS